MSIVNQQACWKAEDGPPLLNITVGDLLDQRAAEQPDLLFLVCCDEETGGRVPLTLSAFKARTDAFARGLIALGIQPGDKVAILASNRPEWLVANFAVPKIGAVLVTVNTHVRKDELAHVLRQAEVRAIVMQRAHRGNPFLEHLRALAPSLGSANALTESALPNLAHVIMIGESAPVPGTLAFDEIERSGSAVAQAPLLERQKAVRRDDVWQIQFTSGTTGAPKGAMLTHVGTVNNAWIFGSAAGLREGDRIVSTMPLFHTAGNIMELLGALVHKGTLIKGSAFEPGFMLRLIEHERPTIICAVPTMFIAMMNHERYRSGQVDTSSLRLMIGGGVPMPIALLRRITQEMGIEAQFGFGMTELSPMVTCTRAEDSLERKCTTVGRPLPHIDVKVARADGSCCALDEPGELCVRGFGVTAGYYRQPEATAKTIDSEGWLHSGDQAVMEQDGTVKIVGRIKDMIKRGGENVYPAEVENFLMQHPKIAQVQVVGVPDDYMGEEGAAFVQVRPGEAVTEAELRDHCRANMARHKLPKYFRFVDSYPLTPSGKVMKYALRERLIGELRASGAPE